MITRLALSTVEQGLPKYRSMLAGNNAYYPSDFDSIATVTVGSGGASNVEFTNIPQTFSHLQIRAISQTNRSSYTIEGIYMQVNGVTSANYSRHELVSSEGYNDTVSAQGGGSDYYSSILSTISGVKANFFGAAIVDILDYSNTNKYKTIRHISGADSNGDTLGYHTLLFLGTGALYANTNAITSIKFTPQVGTSFNQYTKFALYGIRSA